jgi:NodT family efflux transporter outer membrane factor (OMF) lipoprotein
MKHLSTAMLALVCILFSGCMVGPRYVKPSAPLAPAYKEEALSVAEDGWRVAQPADTALRGEWWEVFNDPQLNALEEQIATSNQSLKIAESHSREARAMIGYNRAAEAPTISVGPSIGSLRDSQNQPYFNQSAANNGGGNFLLPVDLSYEIDLWGRIRRSVNAARENAQSSAADLATAQLSLQAELAIDYFELRDADSQQALLSDTVQAYQQALQLTQNRFEGGASPKSDVTQAATQLQQAQVQLTDVGVLRAQYEHAIATLIGEPPASFSLPAAPMHAAPPAMVPGLPSELLERRPDIASAERQMAQANEQIGIARAAYFPTFGLGGEAGFEGASALNWLTWPSRFWSVGPTFSETLFDAGRRRASSQMALANYDATVANYRQTTLTALQEVEDNLAALRILDAEAQQQHQATAAAEESLTLFNNRYQGGVDTYLQVITSQTTALQNERNDIDIQRRRMDATVLLIKALGGGWTTVSLPKL